MTIPQYSPPVGVEANAADDADASFSRLQFPASVTTPQDIASFQTARVLRQRAEAVTRRVERAERMLRQRLSSTISLRLDQDLFEAVGVESTARAMPRTKYLNLLIRAGLQSQANGLNPLPLDLRRWLLAHAADNQTAVDVNIAILRAFIAAQPD